MYGAGRYQRECAWHMAHERTVWHVWSAQEGKGWGDGTHPVYRHSCTLEVASRLRWALLPWRIPPRASFEPRNDCNSLADLVATPCDLVATPYATPCGHTLHDTLQPIDPTQRDTLWPHLTRHHVAIP